VVKNSKFPTTYDNLSMQSGSCHFSICWQVSMQQHFSLVYSTLVCYLGKFGCFLCVWNNIWQANT